MKPSPLEKNGNGAVTWTQQAGDKYIVTGSEKNGRRFKITTDLWMYAQGINVYRGSKWLVRDGKRHLIQRVFN